MASITALTVLIIWGIEKAAVGLGDVNHVNIINAFASSYAYRRGNDIPRTAYRGRTQIFIWGV